MHEGQPVIRPLTGENGMFDVVLVVLAHVRGVHLDPTGDVSVLGRCGRELEDDTNGGHAKDNLSPESVEKGLNK